MRSSVALLVTLALACTGTRPPPAAPPSSTTSAAGNLRGSIPAETAYALLLERAVFDAPGATVWTEALRTTVVESIAEEAAEGGTKPEDRFWREIGQALGTLDDAGLSAMGWWPGRSEAVLYGVGLVPVMRIHGDGERLAALVRRAAASTGFALVEATVEGRPYLVIPSDDEDPWLVIATRADQIALAATRHPEAIAAHLTSFAALGAGSLDAAWPHDTTAHLLMFDPARFAPLLADRRELAHMTAAADPLAGGCVPAVATLIAALPRTTATMAWDARRLTIALGFDLAAASVASWQGEGAPAWTADPGDVPVFRIGLGVPPLAWLHQLAPAQSLVVAADTACSSEPGDTSLLSEALTDLAMFHGVQGATMEMAALVGADLTISVAVATRDVAGLWSLLARAVPLVGTTVPAVGEVRNAVGVPLKLGVGPQMIAMSVGAGAGPRLAQLLAASPGPRMPVALRLDRSMMEGFANRRFRLMDEPFGDDDPGETPKLPGNVVVDSALDGRHLDLQVHVALD